uniref:Uncharacterized protein n=1 Tax=Tetradesmus obliquus TaxID=3088 RepID=A0A383VGX0_TETOB|eukprot:jgi/Sobl393_1/16184/SZX63992.1
MKGLNVLGTVQLVKKGNNATCARRDLFTSQLAREHPVPFFQFLDICARSEQLDELSMLPLLHLFQNGSSRIGTKGLESCSAALQQQQQRWAPRCAAV